MIIVILTVLGLCFGSFVNALVWRLHKQDEVISNKQNTKGTLVPDTSSLKPTVDRYSILRGRSMCPHCKHELIAKDLIPVLSWLSLRSKCRYCKKPISWQYPLVELTTAVLFVASYFFWPDELSGWETLYFGLWLVLLIGLMALVVYDLRWMLLPNKIVFTLYWIAGAMILVQMLVLGSVEPLWRALIGVIVGGGLFYLLFQISNGKWIGGGDVKLGFLLGAVVGGPDQALLMLFIASLLGSLVSIPLLLSKKANKGTRIPFGPFLIMGTFIVQLWGTTITTWYVDTFIG